jgi:hypothetical protein
MKIHQTPNRILTESIRLENMLRSQKQYYINKDFF